MPDDKSKKKQADVIFEENELKPTPREMDDKLQAQVHETIAKITSKIDDLRENLVSYEQKIDLTLKEIPRDIRSLNNSNFNLSSARYHYTGLENQDATYESQLLNHLDRLTNKDR